MPIVNLNDADDTQLYGGKAAHLAMLLQAGLPVPNGLAVSVDVFDSSGKLKAIFERQLTEKIDKNKTYAVRSSASVEDAAQASWAGQFESFLDTKAIDLIATIENCHNSANARTLSYAKKLGDAQKKFAISVVVQEMLHPQYAGVLFTRDPVTGENQFVVEYVAGLGEQLVSGTVNPEYLTWQEGQPLPSAPFKLAELIELAQKTETLFKSPQDIEWAVASGTVWLLQARPITTVL